MPSIADTGAALVREQDIPPMIPMAPSFLDLTWEKYLSQQVWTVSGLFPSSECNGHNQTRSWLAHLPERSDADAAVKRVANGNSESEINLWG